MISAAMLSVAVEEIRASEAALHHSGAAGEPRVEIPNASAEASGAVGEVKIYAPAAKSSGAAGSIDASEEAPGIAVAVGDIKTPKTAPNVAGAVNGHTGVAIAAIAAAAQQATSAGTHPTEPSTPRVASATMSPLDEADAADPVGGLQGAAVPDLSPTMSSAQRSPGPGRAAADPTGKSAGKARAVPRGHHTSAGSSERNHPLSRNQGTVPQLAGAPSARLGRPQAGYPAGDPDRVPEVLMNKFPGSGVRQGEYSTLSGSILAKARKLRGSAQLKEGGTGAFQLKDVEEVVEGRAESDGAAVPQGGPHGDPSAKGQQRGEEELVREHLYGAGQLDGGPLVEAGPEDKSGGEDLAGAPAGLVGHVDAIWPAGGQGTILGQAANGNGAGDDIINGHSLLEGPAAGDREGRPPAGSSHPVVQAEGAHFRLHAFDMELNDVPTRQDADARGSHSRELAPAEKELPSRNGGHAEDMSYEVGCGAVPLLYCRTRGWAGGLGAEGR